MQNTEIKIIVVKTKGLTKLVDVMEAFQGILDRPVQYHTINISPKIDHALLKDTLRALYKADISIRDGVTGGCYGARDGSTAPGFTVWVDASLLADRCVDDKGQEYANIHHMIIESGGKLVKNSKDEPFDGEDLEQVFEDAGHTWKRDNSYNWSGNANEVEFMFDFDFAVCETEKKALLSIKYHCGGDPRGNYTDKVVYSFDSIDDLYSAIMPCKQLTDGEE